MSAVVFGTEKEEIRSVYRLTVRRYKDDCRRRGSQNLCCWGGQSTKIGLTFAFTHAAMKMSVRTKPVEGIALEKSTRGVNERVGSSRPR